MRMREMYANAGAGEVCECGGGVRMRGGMQMRVRCANAGEACE